MRNITAEFAKFCEKHDINYEDYEASKRWLEIISFQIRRSAIDEAIEVVKKHLVVEVVQGNKKSCSYDCDLAEALEALKEKV